MTRKVYLRSKNNKYNPRYIRHTKKIVQSGGDQTNYSAYVFSDIFDEDVEDELKTALNPYETDTKFKKENEYEIRGIPTKAVKKTKLFLLDTKGIPPKNIGVAQNRNMPTQFVDLIVFSDTKVGADEVKSIKDMETLNPATFINAPVIEVTNPVPIRVKITVTTDTSNAKNVIEALNGGNLKRLSFGEDKPPVRFIKGENQNQLPGTATPSTLKSYTIQAPPNDQDALKKATDAFGSDKVKTSTTVKQKVSGIKDDMINELKRQGLEVRFDKDNGMIVKPTSGSKIVKVVNIDNYGIPGEVGTVKYVDVFTNPSEALLTYLKTQEKIPTNKGVLKIEKTGEVTTAKFISDVSIKTHYINRSFNNISSEVEKGQTYIALKLESDGKIEEPAVLLTVTIDDTNPKEKEKLSFLLKKNGYTAVDDNTGTSVSTDSKNSNLGAEVVVENMKGVEIKDVKYDETNFDKLYKDLIGDSQLKLGNRSIKLMLEKPSDQKKKEELYSILVSVDKSIDDYYDILTETEEQRDARETEQQKKSLLVKLKEFIGIDIPPLPEDKINEMKLKLTPADTNEKPNLKKLLVQSLAEDIFIVQDRFANQSDISSEAMDFKITKSKVDTFGWWFGKLPLFMIEVPLRMIRSKIRGYGKISFSTDEKARTMLNQKRADAEKGIKNEFSIMSAFIGTESQKTAAKTAIIVGVASCGWAIVGKIQQNPALAALVMGAVSATGVGGVMIGGALIACGVAYYAVLKLKEKYNKYYEINRSLNELTILLHRIQKLIRLSVLISNTYNFDIAISEILEQLKILFSRFDEMLKADDYNGIQGMINANATPDLDMTAVITKAAGDAATENRINAEIAQKDPWYKRGWTKTKELSKKAFEALKSAGKSFGNFIYVMSFDEELWYSKLNSDVIKLNIYLTTTIGEFNLVLNVLQMGYITKGLKGSEDAKTALQVKQDHISRSSEYMRMLIGILLNDILKLRVNVSYCTRGSAGLTKDELVCLGYQDTDGAGNIVTTYRRQLHSMIITISEKLRDTTSVYGQVPGLKDKVMDTVVKPYIKILEKLKKDKNSPKDEDKYITLPDELQNALKESVRTSAAFYKRKSEVDKMILDVNNKIKNNLDKKENVDGFNEKIQVELGKISKGLVLNQRGGWELKNPFKRKDPVADAQAAADTAAAEKQAAAEAAAQKRMMIDSIGKDAVAAQEKAAQENKKDDGPKSDATTTVTTPDPGAKTDANGKKILPPTAEDRITELVDGVTAYITTEPYVTIPDKLLSEFLTDVYNFSKTEGKTTEAETEEALENAIENAQKVQSEEAINDEGGKLSSQHDATRAAKLAEQEASGNIPSNPSSGGRRLTRKRCLKKRANLRITRIKRKMYQHSKIKVKAPPKVGIINNKFGNYMVSMPAGRMK